MENLTERIKEYLLPVKIVSRENCENAERLLTAVDDQAYLSYDSPLCRIKSGGYVILDFGKELHGGVRILTACGDAPDPISVRIRFGESVGESCAELNGADNATNDHALRDFNVNLPTRSALEFGPTGFRFVRIDNLDGKDYFCVSLNAYYEHLRVLPKGRFNCSDALLNDIYSVAARTVFLNMQTRVWDGIKRDRLVWIGDMHPEAKSIFALYGAHPLLEKSLAETAERNPLDVWMNSIPSYSAWWLAIFCDYYLYTANRDFALSVLPYARALAEKLCACADGEGNVYYGVKDWGALFLNWETLGERGIECGHRGLLLWTLKKYVRFAESFGENCETERKAIERLDSNRKFNGTSKAVAALYSLGYGRNATAEKILVAGGADGYSPFMSSYIGEALANAGRTDKAIDDMKKFYGGMLARGATSFWESFDISWLEGSGRIDEPTPAGLKDIHRSFGKECYAGYRLSLCHGWSSGPVSFFTEKILGVRFAEAGGKKIRISPELCGLKFAEGLVPTAFGDLFVRHETQPDGSVKTTVRAPKGSEIIK